jgi:uncharacterized OsmC-like protein
MDYAMTDTGYRTDYEFGTLKIAGDVRSGFRPFQLMTASIAGCSGGVLRKIMAKQRLAVQDIEIQAKVQRQDDGIKRIQKIHLHFIIRGENLNPEKVRKAVELGYNYCSMVQSVKDSIDITESFEIEAI